MKLEQTLTRYCRTIRNPEKRGYAFDYVAHQMANGSDKEPAYRCTYMAAQAVRQQINEIFRKAGH